MIRTAIAAAVLAVVAAGATPAFADGNAVKGLKVFKQKCKACHDVEGKNKLGPHLDGIIGRTAGSVEDFQSKYSDAMKAKGTAAEPLVWSEETLTEYLKDPKGFVPGNKMAFAGFPKEKDAEKLADLIAFLKADPKPTK